MVKFIFGMEYGRGFAPPGAEDWDSRGGRDADARFFRPGRPGVRGRQAGAWHLARRLGGRFVTIGATVPRTGACAVQGEDELKGMELAVEHLNDGHDLIKQIAPKVTKGLLGKQVKLVVGRLGCKAEQRGAGAADLHQRQQDHRQ